MVSFFRFLLVSLVFTLGTTSTGHAASVGDLSCETAINYEIELLESYSNVYFDLVDLDKDGRKEILITDYADGNRAPPEMKIRVFGGDKCSMESYWLRKWNSNFSGWDEVKFATSGKDVFMTLQNDLVGIELQRSYVTYKFNIEQFKSVSYVLSGQVKLPKTIVEITSVEAAQKEPGNQTVERKFDLNGDGTLETISCEYWGDKHQIYGFRLGCEILSEDNNKLYADEFFQTKRAGVLPKKFNGWHIIVEGYDDIIVYETELGYVRISNRFEDFYSTDFFGDDITQMGYKGISIQDCQLICLENEECTAYSYIKSKEWCFPKVGTGQQKENPDVISGVLIDISK